MSHSHLQPAITRTRQDLINSGELFRANEKLPDDRRRSARRGLSECCYSASNLVLIVATVIAIILLVRFFQDQPVADYYEHLLSLSFYRQMIYVVVVMPLVLLVPIFNAFSALLLMSPRRDGREPAPVSKALLRAKLAYQAVLVLLVFLALVFVAPYVRSANLSSQIELEMRKYMRKRYEDDFAYQLVDRIQDEYHCCDQMWYRANLGDKLPFSCFVPNSNYSAFYQQTCSDVLSSLVGNRCYMITGCLIVILAALACLFSIDLVEVLSEASGRYRVDRDGAAQGARSSPASDELDNDSLGGGQKLLAGELKASGQGDFRSEPSIAERLKLAEREREPSHPDTPDSSQSDSWRPAGAARDQLRSTLGPSKPAHPPRSPLNDKADSQLGASKPAATKPEPILLARAQYQLVKRERSQSPMFVSPSPGESADDVSGQDSRAPPERRPIKSALKKTASNSSNIDGPESGAHFGADEYRAHNGLDSDMLSDDDDDDVDDYTERLRQSDSLLRQKQLQREQQTRRSLLSVRFADD